MDLIVPGSGPDLNCDECGGVMIVTETGVSHHVSEAGGIDYEMDRDHAAYTTVTYCTKQKSGEVLCTEPMDLPGTDSTKNQTEADCCSQCGFYHVDPQGSHGPHCAKRQHGAAECDCWKSSILDDQGC